MDSGKYSHFPVFKIYRGARDIAQQLRTLLALTEDTDSAPGTHMVHSDLQLQFQGIKGIFSWPPQVHT